MEINETNFNKIVLNSGIPVVVDFWAFWCKPCIMMSSIIDELSNEYNNKLMITKINIDNNHRITNLYNIMSIPTIIIFKDKKPIVNVSGFKTKENLKKIFDTVIMK